MAEIYIIDRFDDTFLENVETVDIETFNFTSEEFKKAVAEAIRIQQEIDAIPRFRYPC